MLDLHILEHFGLLAHMKLYMQLCMHPLGMINLMRGGLSLAMPMACIKTTDTP